MTEQPIVVVRGEAQREVPPDRAEISVTVRARDHDRETMLARLAERSAALRVLVESHPVDRRETGFVRVYPELKRNSEHVVAYVGSVVTTLTVSEFDGLGEFLRRLAGLDRATVAGPWWRLRPGGPVEAEVRKAAVDEALRRAREYAGAVGARIDRLVEIADETPGPEFGMIAFAGAAGGSDAPKLEVDPETQTVRASVIVRVAITEPTLEP
jgi:hypothetical protein